MSDYQQLVTNAVSDYLKKNRLTKSGLASLLGTLPINVSRRMSGERLWNLQDLYELAAMGVKVPPLDGDRRDK